MKAIGMVFIFLTCTGAGIIKSFEYSNAENELYAFISFIRYIKREVTIYLTRQQEIFDRFENELLEKNGFLPLLRSKEITDEKSSLYHALKEFENRLCINKESQRVIFEFSESFGRMSGKEQEEKCNVTINYLEEIYRKEKENNASRVKLCRYVGCMVGVGAVLLFL